MEPQSIVWIAKAVTNRGGGRRSFRPIVQGDCMEHKRVGKEATCLRDQAELGEIMGIQLAKY